MINRIRLVKIVICYWDKINSLDILFKNTIMKLVLNHISFNKQKTFLFQFKFQSKYVNFKDSKGWTCNLGDTKGIHSSSLGNSFIKTSWYSYEEHEYVCDERLAKKCGNSIRETEG
jgi:hypothetical protein